jgi:hypothetical protein
MVVPGSHFGRGTNAANPFAKGSFKLIQVVVMPGEEHRQLLDDANYVLQRVHRELAV